MSQEDWENHDRDHRLDYQTPEPGSFEPLFVAVGGFVLAVICIGFVSAGWYLQLYPIGFPPAPRHRDWATIGLFAVVVPIGIAGAVWALRWSSRGKWEFFLAGFAIGAAIMASVEGVCFYNT